MSEAVLCAKARWVRVQAYEWWKALAARDDQGCCTAPAIAGQKLESAMLMDCHQVQVQV